MIDRHALARSAAPRGTISWDRPSSPDRMPHRLQLEESGDLPQALPVAGAVHDALDVLGREPVELLDLAVDAADVDRVHIHMARKPGRQLLLRTREDVDDAARE